MKKLIYCLLFFANFVFAQNGCITTLSNCDRCYDTDPLISTKPCPSCHNTFDWTNESTGSLTFNSYLKTGEDCSTLRDGLPQNPYYSTDGRFLGCDRDWSGGIDRGVCSDYKWEDGWEILALSTGYDRVGNKLGNLSNCDENPRIPSFVLYNRYTGMIRVWSVPVPNGLQTGGNVYLHLLSPEALQRASPNGKFAPTNDYMVNGMFSQNGGIARTLDKETDIYTVKSYYGGDGGGWVGADFQTAYDPCVCNFDSRIEVGFQSISVSDVKMYGRFVGTGTPADGEYDLPSESNLTSWMASTFTDKDAAEHPGLHSYRRLEALVERYDVLKERYELSEKTKQALEIVSKVFETIAGIITLGAGGAAVGAGEEGISDLLKSKFEVVDKSFGSVANVFGLAASTMDFLSTADKPTSPMFLQGEIAMSGKVTGIFPLDSYNFNIEVPRSDKMNPQPTLYNASVPPSQQPVYNEPLGLFTLIREPVVKRLIQKIPSEKAKYYIISNNCRQYDPTPSRVIDIDESYKVNEIYQLIPNSLDNGRITRCAVWVKKIEVV